MAVSVRQFIGGILGGSGGSSETYATISQLPLVGNVQGSLAFVVENNRLYIWNGTGWFNIALINTNPTITQGPNPSYVFAADGTPIVITLIAEDPEGIPITWSSQVTSGTLGNTAVILQNDNVFTVTPSTDSADAAVFGVTFTASDGVNIATAASSFTLTFGVADPYYKQSVLVSTTAADNGTNNVFVDSSTNNFAITRAGNTTQGTFSPHSPAGWSGYFDGSGDYLTAPDNAAWDFGTSNFTIESWIYSITSGTGRSICSHFSGSDGFSFELDSSNRLTIWLEGSYLLTASSSISINTWNHVVVSRSSNTLLLFLNGVQVGTVSNSTDISGSSSALAIAGTPSGTFLFTGYISNLRVVKGTAVYTANFTPPTEPLTAIAGTSLLTLQDNRFIDRSTNNFAITRVGDTRVVAFSPFDPADPYSTAANSGSAYFDGTGDYLTVGSSTAVNFGTSDYTIEFFVFFSSLKNYIALFDCRPTTRGIQWFVGVNGDVYFDVKDGDTTQIMRISGGNGTVRAGEWTHMAVCRSGTTTTMYVKGAVIASNASDSNSYTSANNRPVIGSNYSGGDNLTGYISNLRIVKGTAVYTSAFTPPAAPVTAIANTSLLLNSTNAGVYDETGKVVLETVGDAKTSTAVVKYGATSMAFDGTGDYIVHPASINYGYGTGNFTIEFWVYFNTVSLDQTIVSSLTSASSVNPHIYLLGASSTIRYYTNNADRIVGSAVSINTWYHVAVSRAAGSTRLFINGTQSGSTYTDLNNYGTSAPLGIGTYYSAGSPVTISTLNGYMQDLRITQGHARYTTNFTPPTAQLGFSNPE